MSVVVPTTDNSVIIRGLIYGKKYTFEVVTRAARQILTGSEAGSDQPIMVFTTTASSSQNGCETRN